MGGPSDFSVSPRPLGDGFETKGLGPELDKISYRLSVTSSLVVGSLSLKE